ncbi:DeoR/GlpR family DNA-binding transcription regulator [Leucobacter celer]|jgi:DeoR/GlpR family transcriptional regulator of sugar metabolism|uniref:DeoR/GlpR family DNA-binding transcription regulator n=1 Tax=Leucobacter celer TaxID=668625 RepID=UPI0006A7ACAE|nr:DeoR/GlpR family DNA-binding transcription regulator [Leucobacter celer]
MEAQERRELIERRILSDGEASFKTLSQEFGVSEMTVRRDLELLEQSGSVRRIMGGAIAAHGTAVEPGFDARALVSAREKVGISIAAVEHLIPGETVVLDSGSTALAVARTIIGRGLALTVVTPSILVAAELHNEPNTTVLVTGGTVRPGELSLIGAESVAAFERYNCDVYIMGVSGVDGKRGLSDYSTEEAAVKRAALRAAERVIVVADASKLGRVHLTNVAQPGEIDLLITDGPADHPALVGLRAAGVAVECVPAL